MFGKKKQKEPETSEYDVKIGDDIDALLKKYEKEITGIMKDMENAFAEHIKASEDDLKLDDLFVLRYFLSAQGDVTKAKDNIKAALKWRLTNAAIIKTLKFEEGGSGFSFVGSEAQNKDFKFLDEHVCAGMLGEAGDFSAPIQWVRTGHTFQKLALTTVKPDSIVLYQLLKAEGIYRLCDTKTRESRKLVMSIQIVDMANFSLFGKKSDKKFFGFVNQAGELGEFIHPLFRAGKFVVNASRAVTMLKGLFGKKNDAINYSNTKQLLGDKIIIDNKVVEVLPDALGGSAEIPKFFKDFKK